MAESVADALAPALAKLDGGATGSSAGPDGRGTPPPSPGPAAERVAVGDLVTCRHAGDGTPPHGRLVASWVDENGERRLLLVAGVRRSTENRRFRYTPISYTVAADTIDPSLTVSVAHDPVRCDRLVHDLLLAAADELARRHRREFDELLGWALTLDRAVREVGR